MLNVPANFFESVGQWISGAKTPEVGAKISFEPKSVYLTGGVLGGVALIALGIFKVILDKSLDNFATRLGH
jgi:hypothetical protein